ncbi:MAG: alpha-L-arabinofuranosidase C-terminal domain-containing protein [Promethearchaeota archaeon]
MTTITIASKDSRCEAPREILGHFIEHLGMCIENGLWTYGDTRVELLDEPPLERVRRDLFDAIHDLAPPVIRYPGGCFSDTYHWQDGTGPRAGRPTRRNRAWGGMLGILGPLGPRERNHFGTDEFLALCERLGAEPYLNVNYGTGTPEEAANWVEYVNGDSRGTRLGKARAHNGHPEPYNVKYWGIANEIYGWHERGHERKAESYARRYLEFARAMRAVDPSIKLVAVGWDRSSTWNKKLLGIIKNDVDFLSIHRYFTSNNPLKFILGKDPYPRTKDAYYIQLNSAATIEMLVQEIEGDILSSLGPAGLESCKIAFDEWNAWKTFRQAIRADMPPYNLLDGLWNALVLNVFIRNARSIGMANFAQLVNCLGMILTYKEKIVLTPHYHVFMMYSDGWQPVMRKVSVDGPTISTRKYSKHFPEQTTPIVDAACLESRDATNISLFIVNKHFDEMQEVSIQFDGDVGPPPVKNVKGTFLTHGDPFACNTVENPRVIQPLTLTVERAGFDWVIQVPPRTLMVIKVEVAK